MRAADGPAAGGRGTDWRGAGGRWARWIAAGTLIVAAALLAVAATRPTGATASPPVGLPPTVRPAYPDTLPVGLGLDLAGRSCLMCHSSTLIAQQHKDSTAWEKTLTQMTTWGAPLTAGERDTLRRYLVENFGPRP